MCVCICIYMYNILDASICLDITTFKSINLMLFRFIEKLQQDIPGKGVKQQLELLCSIYALFLLHKHLGDFLATGCITPKQGSLANELLRSLYSQVCPKRLQLIGKFFILWNWLIYWLYVLVRFVLMQLHLLMRLTTLITTLVRFLVAMMEMCIQSCTRRHGRIHWMIQLCQMASKNIFDQC